MTTLLDTLTKGATYLEGKGVDSPRLTMELLAAKVLKLKRMELYLQFDRPLEEKELADLRELLKKRGERIPLQHLLGEVDFYKRSFLCDERALIPRPETEELIEHILKLPLEDSVTILDLCCGSGVMGLTMKAELEEKASVMLSDLSPAALSLASENKQRLNLEVELVQSDLFHDIEETFDLIICNPPYIPEGEDLEAEVLHDPEIALFSGEDGLGLIRDIASQGRRHLNSGGYLALEIGHDQADRVTAILAENGYHDIRVEEDLEKNRRFPIARWD